jgi:beta-fructofuranosidase
VLSLPRELSLGPGGQVCANPAPELAALRAEHTCCAAIEVPAGQAVVVPEIAGDTLELMVELAPARDGLCGIVVRRTPEGAEQTRIVYDAVLRQLIVDRTQSSLKVKLHPDLIVSAISTPALAAAARPSG